LLSRLSALGEFYWSCDGYVSVADFASAREDWRKALTLFLRTYAFERQGRSPHYAPAAVAPLQHYKKPEPAVDFERAVNDRYNMVRWAALLWRSVQCRAGPAPADLPGRLGARGSPRASVSRVLDDRGRLSPLSAPNAARRRRKSGESHEAERREPTDRDHTPAIAQSERDDDPVPLPRL